VTSLFGTKAYLISKSSMGPEANRIQTLMYVRTFKAQAYTWHPLNMFLKKPLHSSSFSIHAVGRHYIIPAVQ